MIERNENLTPKSALDLAIDLMNSFYARIDEELKLYSKAANAGRKADAQRHWDKADELTKRAHEATRLAMDIANQAKN